MYLLSDIIFYTPDLKAFIALIIILLLLLASAFLSGSEIAFFNLRPLDLEGFRNSRLKKAGAALKLYNRPEELISTILAGNILVKTSVVILSTYFFSRVIDSAPAGAFGIIIQVVIIFFVLFLFGEIIPKIYATRNYVNMALSMARPLLILEKVLRPVTSLMLFASALVKRKSENTIARMNDMSDNMELTSDKFDKEEQILKKIVNFGNINVNAIMCPRIDVTAVDITTSFDKILQTIIETEFSRIPVYKGSFDTVKGILYARDVLPYINSPANFKWQSLLRPPYFVPETKKINDLLKEFQIKKIHMAVVIDEYGGTSGIITLDDILEEIVGELGEEEQEMYRKLDDLTFIFEGKVLLNDFYKIIGMEGDPFEEVRGESETLAGLMLELTGEIPQKDRKIQYRNYNFTIESADKRKIREIRVQIDNPEQDAFDK
jgi:gliding motility-associated protein GldE